MTSGDIELDLIREILDGVVSEVTEAIAPLEYRKIRRIHIRGVTYAIAVRPVGQRKYLRIPFTLSGDPWGKTWIAFDVSSLPTAGLLALKRKYTDRPFQDNGIRGFVYKILGVLPTNRKWGNSRQNLLLYLIESGS